MTQPFMPQSAPPDKQSAPAHSASNLLIGNPFEQMKLLMGDKWGDAWCVAIGPSDPQSKWFGGYAPEVLKGAREDDAVYVCVSAVAGRRVTQCVEEVRLFVLDDLGTKGDMDAAIEALGLPRLMVETSPGNFTGFWVYAEPVLDPRVHVSLMKAAIDKGLGDDLRDPTRIMRLGVGQNYKSDVKARNRGKPWDVRLDLDRMDVSGGVVDAELLAEKWGVDLSEGALSRINVKDSVIEGSANLENPDPVLEALIALGRTLDVPKPGVVNILCPFIDEHTSRPETGTAYLGGGMFKCHHASCADRQSWHYREAILELIEEELTFGTSTGRGWVAARCFEKHPLDADELRRLHAKGWAEHENTSIFPGKTVDSVNARALLEAGAEFFKDENGRECVYLDGKTYRLDVEPDQNALANFARRQTGKHMSKSQKATFLELLSGAAQDGPTHSVHKRTAPHPDGGLFYFLANEEQERIRVHPDGSGLSIIKASRDFRFDRPPGQLPQVRPEDDGRGLPFNARLREHINVPPVSDPDSPHDQGVGADAALLTANVSWVLPQGMKAGLLLGGQAGSGKTTAGKRLITLIDPMRAPVRHMPSNSRDTIVQGQHALVVCLDNLTIVSSASLDTMSLMLTGGGVAERQLFSNGGVFTAQVKCGFILTGLNPDLISKADALSRFFSIDVVPLETRKTEADLDAAFEQARPALLHSFYTLLSKGLASVDTIKAEWEASGRPTVRMLDAAIVAEGMARAMGWRDNLLIDALVAQAEESTAALISDNPVAVALERLAKRISGPWQGNAADLLQALPFGSHPKMGTPQTAKGLASVLADIAPKIDRIGVKLTRSPKRTDRGWIWRLEPMGGDDGS